MSHFDELLKSKTKYHVLNDGRTLAYLETGDPEGIPVFYAHGGPGSRLEGEFFHEAALRKGFRIIATDRPGTGESTYLKDRVLLDYPRDIAELADALELDKFGVMGWSGGGIYTTACAYAIPARLLFNITFAGYTNWAELPNAKQYISQNNKLDHLAIGMSQNHPIIGRFFFEMMNLSEKFMPKATYNAIVKQMNITDKAIAAMPEFQELFMHNQRVAFRQGAKGQARDAYIHYCDWGFRLEEIQFHLHVFHGTEDRFVPIKYSQHIAKNVSSCELHFWEGEGHLAPYEHLDEIFDIAQSEVNAACCGIDLFELETIESCTSIL